MLKAGFFTSVTSGSEEAGRDILGTARSATGPGAGASPESCVDAEYEETVVTCCE